MLGSSCSSPPFFSRGSCLTLPASALQPSCWTPGALPVCLASLPKSLCYKPVWPRLAFPWMLGFQTRPLCLHSKHTYPPSHIVPPPTPISAVFIPFSQGKLGHLEKALQWCHWRCPGPTQIPLCPLGRGSVSTDMVLVSRNDNCAQWHGIPRDWAASSRSNKQSRRH